MKTQIKQQDGVIKTIQNAILLIYLTLQISMETNRVALQTTKTKVTMELTKMRLIRYLRKERKRKKNKQNGHCQNQNLH